MNPIGAALQEERRHCVASDAARKRSALRWIRRGASPPPSLLRREVEEFDRRHAIPPPPPPAPRYEVGSSSRAGSSSSAPRAPTSPPTFADDGEYEAYDPSLFRDAIGPEDFVPEEALESVTARVLARSGRDHEDDRKRCRFADELDDLLLEQGLNSERSFRDRQADWEREKGKQKRVFIEHGSDEED